MDIPLIRPCANTDGEKCFLDLFLAEKNTLLCDKAQTPPLSLFADTFAKSTLVLVRLVKLEVYESIDQCMQYDSRLLGKKKTTKSC